jgi:hypothetical protein
MRLPAANTGRQFIAVIGPNLAPEDESKRYCDFEGKMNLTGFIIKGITGYDS